MACTSKWYADVSSLDIGKKRWQRNNSIFYHVYHALRAYAGNEVLEVDSFALCRDANLPSRPAKLYLAKDTSVLAVIDRTAGCARLDIISAAQVQVEIQTLEREMNKYFDEKLKEADERKKEGEKR